MDAVAAAAENPSALFSVSLVRNCYIIIKCIVIFFFEVFIGFKKSLLSEKVMLL